METVKTFTHNGYTVKIKHDEDPCNPILDDYLVKVIMWHKNYDFGNFKGYSPEEFEEFCKEEGAIRLPLYLYDHSGVTVNTTGFNCPWDSGQVGWVFVTPDDLVATVGVLDPYELLVSMVKVLDDYLTGNCFGFEIYKTCASCGAEEEFIDSCWGFFGDYDQEDGVIDAAKEAVPEPEKESPESWSARQSNQEISNKRGSYAI